MSGGFPAALHGEALKARRARVPALTAAAMLLLPLTGGLFMYILADPARARSLGILGAKAQLTAGTADWPGFLGFLAQGLAVGGWMAFSIVTAWVFGREFSDRTAKELLALPTSRTSIVLAKLVVIAVLALALAALVFGGGLAVGAALRLPGWTGPLVIGAALDALVIALCTYALCMPLAWAASAGRGLLAAIGVAILLLFVTQIVTALGGGPLFPWAVPALHAGMAGARATQLSAMSYVLVFLVGVVGVLATISWWRHADQSR